MQMKNNPNSHITPETQIYFICIKDDMEIKMIQLLEYKIEAIFVLLEWETISKKIIVIYKVIDW